MEANIMLRMEKKSSKSYNVRIIGSIAVVAVVLIAAFYALAVQFPIGPEKLAAFAFPP
jgi:hypothetical protein